MEIQWSLVLFTAISGTGACYFSFAVLQALLGKAEMPKMLDCIISVVLLGVGGMISVTHIIYHVDRIVEALSNPTSGIFIEACGVGIMCVLILIYFLMVWRNTAEMPRKVVAILIMVVGIVFAFECGNSYSMDSRPAWTTWLLPLGYCLTAIGAGAALNLMVKALTKTSQETLSFAGLLTLIGCALGILGNVMFIVSASAQAIEANGGITWCVLTIVLMVIAAALGALAYKKPENALSIGACATICAVVSAVGYRIVMWLVGAPLLNFFLMALD